MNGVESIAANKNAQTRSLVGLLLKNAVHRNIRIIRTMTITHPIRFSFLRYPDT